MRKIMTSYVLYLGWLVSQLTEAGAAVRDPEAEAGVGKAAGEDRVEAKLLVRLVWTAGLSWEEIE